MSFMKLGGLRALTNVPFMALTATASKETQTAICDSLHLNNPVVISQTVDRPNIYLSASPIRNISVSLHTFT